MGNKSSRPSGRKARDKVKLQSDIGLQLPLRALKGALANNRGEGMSFAEIREACARVRAKTSLSEK